MKHLRDRGWDKLRPSDLAKSISIEAAELLELFQWVSVTLEETKKDKGKIKAIKNELADVLIYCLEMSVLLGLDTEKIVKTKLAYVAKKYPAKLMKKRQVEAGSDSDVYWKIKKAYRMKGL